MSFRNRLTLFFVLIVIVPMIAATVVVFLLLAESETGKTDARLSEAQGAAVGLYEQAVGRADGKIAAVGRDRGLVTALRGGDAAGVRARVRVLVRGGRGLRRLQVTRAGRVLAVAGDPRAVAPAGKDLVVSGNVTVGRVELSVSSAEDYARTVRRLAGLDVVVRRGRRTLGTSSETLARRDLPVRGSTRVGRRPVRVTSFSAPDFDRGRLRVGLVADTRARSSSVTAGRVLAFAVLAAFLVLAFVFAFVVSRSLQGQVRQLLEAARRLAGGDFSETLPTSGGDEFAALGGEFNKMSRELEARMLELRAERARLAESIKRLGRTAAASLNREALLELVIQSAVDGAGATCGRARSLDGPGVSEHAVVEGQVDGLGEILEAAEAQAAERQETVQVTRGAQSALSHPLRPRDARDRLLGLITVAREGRAFSEAERELLVDLAAQAGLSLENVALHEQIQRQAVTDELTGLANHRRFQEVISVEIERSRRFGQPLGLVLLDIDNFKMVNDTYGHQQGDLVLREVARVVRENAREIDEPARYGGEELAVALPQTNLPGAVQAAERIRLALARLVIPRLDGGGDLRVTASFGVAALPESAEGQAELIAQADRALYRAKKAGKNRTETPTDRSVEAVAAD